MYSLAEQGKEFLHISIPKPLLPSFQATRELIHRDVLIHFDFKTSILLFNTIQQINNN